MHVLIVEDDPLLGKGLKNALMRKNFTVDLIEDGGLALDAIELNAFDVIILDLNLPKKSGMDILKAVRQIKKDVPILILTAKDNLKDKLTGLEEGADDYMTKPFETEELIARLNAIHRRRYGITSSKINFRGLSINMSNRSVFRGKEYLEVSQKEFLILVKLIENAGNFISRNVLEEYLYDWSQIVESNAVEVHIHHLRKKLGKDFIRNVRGVGYMIQDKE